MATIPGLKKVGDFWHYSIQVNGQRAHGSTKAKDLQTARKVLDEKRRELLNDQMHLTKRVPPSLNQLFEAWWKVNQSTFSPGHLSSVECRYRIWIRPALGSRRIDKIQTDDVLRLRSFQIEEGCSPRYANNATELLRALVRFALELGHIDRLPFSVKALRLQKLPRQTLPAASVRTFLETVDTEARNPHVPVILRVMIGLGLRESEALRMRWEWFNHEDQTYTVGKAKGKEARVLPVPDWLWESIYAMPKSPSPWVFPANDGNPHRAQFCKKPLRRVCQKLGLGNITQHRLRATFATLHAETGTPITEIQGMLGHKDITTTMIYVEPNLHAKRKAQEALSREMGLHLFDASHR